MRNEIPTPMVVATVVWMPRERERWTVAWTVSSAVHGARNGICESSTDPESHQAAVAAMTDLPICIRSVVTSGSRIQARRRGIG